MILDARSLSNSARIECDVCIVGAGAAGITLAREFSHGSLRLVVLEGGDFMPSGESQSLYEGKIEGLSYAALQAARLRYFGGTTNHWEGTCRSLDAIDFTERPWVPYSGWPITSAALEPFYARAQRVCQLGPYDYTTERWAHPEKRPLLPFSSERLRTVMFQFSPPTRFGIEYKQELQQAANVTIYVNANVLAFETSQAGRQVSAVQVGCFNGTRFRVHSKRFILAAGGIENPRILLLSRDAGEAGLGNHNDLVGRFFMEHPHVHAANIVLSPEHDSLALYKERAMVEGHAIEGVLALPEEVQRSESLLNVSVLIHRVDMHPAAPPESIYAARRLFEKKLGDSPDEGFLHHLATMLGDLDGLAGYVLKGLVHSEGAGIPVMRVKFRNEQAPNPDSRVRLDDVRDALGLQRVRLDWRLTELDHRSVAVATGILAREFGAAGLGRLRVRLSHNPEHWEIGYGFHHMGTTRMSQDPKRGVVDPDCRVHGIENLYVAGSSVFPTVGYANPTLTLVALAIRLADHIKESFT